MPFIEKKNMVLKECNENPLFFSHLKRTLIRKSMNGPSKDDVIVQKHIL